MAAGKRTLTSQLRAPAEPASAPPVAEGAARSESTVHARQVGPGYGSPIPPVAEIRGWMGDQSAVQRKTPGPQPGRDAGDASEIAASGLAGAGSGLPHGEPIQKAFGRHDISQVRAHVGGEAATAAASLGAEAYATGDRVAFAAAPDLHTAAHEAAHVVQQRAGVVSLVGLNQRADAHEQQADAVADAVVAGRSAEPLLDGIPAVASGASASGSVQRRPREDGDFSGEAAPLAGDSEPVWAFAPATLQFSGAGATDVLVRNVSQQSQTIGDFDVVGDDGAFVVGLLPGEIVAAGDAIAIQVTFTPSGDMPHAAALVVRSGGADRFGAGTGRLNIGGIRRGASAGTARASDEGCGVEISDSTPTGNRNSIQGALGSVHAAWGAVFAQQRAGVDIIHGMASKDIPAERRGWEVVLDDLIAEGLVLAAGAVGLHLGAGLALATWNALEKMKLKDEAAAAAKEVAGLTLKVHSLLVNDVTRSIGAQVSSGVRQAINEAPRGARMPVVMRHAFFLGQNKVLAGAYADAVTSLNNREGDFAALEADHAGLGFAALEAYRNHLSCETSSVGTIQSRTTLGMWASFLARMGLGTHDGSSQDAKPGADLEESLLHEKKYGGEWKEDLASGVLDLHVLWDQDRLSELPVHQIKRARVQGLHPDLKAMITTAPLREFPIPFLAHGPVLQRTPTGVIVGGELRVARNEGGAVFATADDARIQKRLEGLGGGGAIEGGKVLASRILEMTLTVVE